MVYTYLCCRWIAGRGSRRGCLGWTVGALRRQRAAALGLTETFAVLFADLQRDNRSGRTEYTQKAYPPSQSQGWHLETDNPSHLHSPTGNLESPVNLNSKSLDCAGELEHTDTGRQVHIQLTGRQVWPSGDSANRYTTMPPPHERCKSPNLYQMPSSWQRFKCHICVDRDNKHRDNILKFCREDALWYRCC